jgi:hypothetical protein
MHTTWVIWLLIDVPELPAAHSQARRLDQVEDVARDLIALLTDADPGSFDVDIKVELPAEVRADLDRAGSDAALSEGQPAAPPGSCSSARASHHVSTSSACLGSDCSRGQHRRASRSLRHGQPDQGRKPERTGPLARFRPRRSGIRSA